MYLSIYIGAGINRFNRPDPSYTHQSSKLGFVRIQHPSMCTVHCNLIRLVLFTKLLLVKQSTPDRCRCAIFKLQACRALSHTAHESHRTNSLEACKPWQENPQSTSKKQRKKPLKTSQNSEFSADMRPSQSECTRRCPSHAWHPKGF